MRSDGGTITFINILVVSVRSNSRGSDDDDEGGESEDDEDGDAGEDEAGRDGKGGGSDDAPGGGSTRSRPRRRWPRGRPPPPPHPAVVQVDEIPGVDARARHSIAREYSLDLVGVTLASDPPVIKAVDIDCHVYARRRAARASSAKRRGGVISD